MEPVDMSTRNAVAFLIGKLRNKNTPSSVFHETMETLSTLVIADALEKAPYEMISVDTPLETTEWFRIEEQKIVAVSILRAGNGMVESFRKLVPSGSIYHVGLARDEETLEPDYYYDSLPKDLSGKTVFILDPMLATGGSASATVDMISERNPESIIYCGIDGAPEGIKLMNSKYPNIPIYLAVIDSHLDNTGYIRPGLGDVGDRLYST